MRGTQEQASARIALLGNIVRTRAPHVYLSDSPLLAGQVERFWRSPENTVGTLDMA